MLKKTKGKDEVKPELHPLDDAKPDLQPMNDESLGDVSGGGLSSNSVSTDKCSICGSELVGGRCQKCNPSNFNAY